MFKLPLTVKLETPANVYATNERYYADPSIRFETSNSVGYFELRGVFQAQAEYGHKKEETVTRKKMLGGTKTEKVKKKHYNKEQGTQLIIAGMNYTGRGGTTHYLTVFIEASLTQITQILESACDEHGNQVKDIDLTSAGIKKFQKRATPQQVMK